MSPTTIFSGLVRHAKRERDVHHHRTVLRATLTRHPAVRQAFMLLPPALRNEAFLTPPSAHDTTVGIGASIHGLTGFKDPALVQVLERFADDGWRAHTQDWPGLLNRDYHFRRTVPLTFEQQRALTRHPSARWLAKNGIYDAAIDAMTVSVTIYTYIRSDSDSCRVVVKGVVERVLREEVKEFVCD